MVSPTIKTTVNISPELYKLAKQNLIKFTEATRVGISILLAEKGVAEYDNRLNIVRLKNEYKIKAAGYAQKAADLGAENEQE